MKKLIFLLLFTTTFYGQNPSRLSSIVSNQFTDGNITWTAAQINRTTGKVELQYSGTDGVRLFGSTGNALTFNQDGTIGGNPSFTGTPTAPTATAGTNTTQIATMEAVQAAVTSNIAQTITNGVTTSAPSQDAVFDALALKAYLNGAVFTGQVEATSFKTGGNVSLNSTGTGLLAPNNGGITFYTNHPSAPGWTSNSNITATFYKTTVYTVATLPITGVTTGTYATVSDALAPTYMTIVVGGGAVVCPVFYDGVSWKCH